MHKIETAKTDSFSMDYFKFGQGEKILVILPGLSIQSVMGSADAIAEAYQPLAEAFTIYVFDRRKDLPASYSLSAMARDTAEAIRSLNMDHVCVFGASQGGMIAMEMAITYPELVDKLVLGSTSACITEAQYAMVEKWIRLAKEKNATDLYLTFGEDAYPRDVFEKSRELLIEAAKTVTEEDLNRYVILGECIKGFNVVKDLEKIVCPVLVIGDTDDRVMGSDAAKLIREHLAQRTACELFMYEGYGHAAYDTAPDYKERLLQFLVP